jgi:hypothetical protein
MNRTEEDFVHYVECIESLNRAWSILQDLGAVERPSAIHAAAFRFALIQYAKPYTVSKGTHGRRKLPPPQLTQELIELHQQILALRDQVLAHSDLDIKDAKLHIHSFNGKPYHLIAQNIVDAFPSREAVITLIEKTLDQMYLESERKLQALPITS